MAFNLNCFLDISSGHPGVLVPVLSSSTTNLPYVQQMDEFFEVKQLVPFLEYENYPVILSAKAQAVAVGEQGIVAFRMPDGSIFSGDIAETLAFLEDNRKLISQSPLLQSQLNRIESAELQPSYDVWCTISSLIFDDKDQRKLWLDSELLIFQKQRQIWGDIDAVQPATKKSNLEGPLAEYGYEFLIHWLANRKNFGATQWSTIWHHVNEGRPFDERIALIGIEWMYALAEEDPDLQQSKSILCALLQLYPSSNLNWEELADYVLDRLNSEPYLIYGFLKPASLFEGLFAFLSVEGHSGELLELIEFCISNVPKDKRVKGALALALLRILGDGSPQVRTDRPARYVDEAQRLAAQGLVESLFGLAGDGS